MASYSITSSARASSVGGMVRPSALAVLRLTGRFELGRRLHRLFCKHLRLFCAAMRKSDSHQGCGDMGVVHFRSVIDRQIEITTDQSWL